MLPISPTLLSNVFYKQATILDLDAYKGIVLVEQKRMLILG
jgi:hypothetical protein